MASIDLVRSAGPSMNLQTLKTTDPNIEQIISTSKHVVLYQLDQDGQWEKCDTEGPLFLVRRRIEPFYSLVLLNRKSPENFVLEFTSNIEIQTDITNKFIFLQIRLDEIVGLWFYDENDLQQKAQLLSKVSESVRGDSNSKKFLDNFILESNKLPNPSPSPSPNSNSNNRNNNRNNRNNNNNNGNNNNTNNGNNNGNNNSNSNKNRRNYDNSNNNNNNRNSNFRYLDAFGNPAPVNIHEMDHIMPTALNQADDATLNRRLESFLNKFEEHDMEHVEKIKKAVTTTTKPSKPKSTESNGNTNSNTSLANPSTSTSNSTSNSNNDTPKIVNSNGINHPNSSNTSISPQNSNNKSNNNISNIYNESSKKLLSLTESLRAESKKLESSPQPIYLNYTINKDSLDAMNTKNISVSPSPSPLPIVSGVSVSVKKSLSLPGPEFFSSPSNSIKNLSFGSGTQNSELDDSSSTLVSNEPINASNILPLIPILSKEITNFAKFRLDLMNLLRDDNTIQWLFQQYKAQRPSN